MRTLLTLSTAGFLALMAAPALAQYSMGQTGQGGPGSTPYNSGGAGMFGSRNVGGGGLSAGQRSFSNGANAGGGANVTGNGGQLDGSERFIRGNRQPGQFVGSDAGDAAFVGSAVAGANQGIGQSLGMGMQGLGNFQQLNRNNPNAQNRNQNNQRNNRMVRTSLSLGFQRPQAATPVVSKRITGILERSNRIAAMSPLQVEVVGQTAVLRGTVASAGDRDLAERVVLLEPGIARVQNDLTVADAPTPDDLIFPPPATAVLPD